MIVKATFFSQVLAVITGREFYQIICLVMFRASLQQSLVGYLWRNSLLKSWWEPDQAGWLPRPEREIALAGVGKSLLNSFIKRCFQFQTSAYFHSCPFQTCITDTEHHFFQDFALWVHLAVLVYTISSCRSETTITEMSHARIIKGELCITVNHYTSQVECHRSLALYFVIIFPPLYCVRPD